MIGNTGKNRKWCQVVWNEKADNYFTQFIFF
jgi:hypothetical protein